MPGTVTMGHLPTFEQIQHRMERLSTHLGRLHHAARLAEFAVNLCERREHPCDREVLRWAGAFESLIHLWPRRERPLAADLAGTYLTQLSLLAPERICLVQTCLRHLHAEGRHPHPVVQAFHDAGEIEATGGWCDHGLPRETRLHIERQHPAPGRWLRALPLVLANAAGRVRRQKKSETPPKQGRGGESGVD